MTGLVDRSQLYLECHCRYLNVPYSRLHIDGRVSDIIVFKLEDRNILLLSLSI